ncbi:MAG TPA: cysteine desulfurase [Candidatus Eisenbacteria bacterium]|nr:cysteine desulfurase [Candidatus Eisenbacteria bacterium]
MKDTLDVMKVRRDFPVLAKAEGKRFAYLDTAASSQTPVQVLEAQDAYYFNFRANIHRGMYALSEKATEQYEGVRRKVADLIRANEDEIVFTRGATESLNLVARGLAKSLGKGDEVVMTIMEHHANLLPWQQLAIERGFAVKAIPVTADRLLDMDAAKALIGPKTKVVAVTAASNVLGTVTPVAELAALARKVGAAVVVDAAQLAGHQPIDVKKMDCDFLAFSGHKMLGPTGTGVLYGKKAMLEALDPMLFGGDMIREVFWDRSTWNEVPWKFEAGTPNIGGVIGHGAAVDYVRLTGIDRIAAHEHVMTAYLIDSLSSTPGVKVVGPSADAPRTGAVSFIVDGIHPHDVATILDAEGVCVRGGHHCAMPLLRELGIMDGVTRASVGLYTTKDEIDLLVAGLAKARRIFRLA